MSDEKLNCQEVARWFVSKNPSLADGYNDENTKLNKLLFFSETMYYSITGKKLLDKQFVAFPNGPVIFDIYRDYRYSNLGKFVEDVTISHISDFQKKILDIVNFVYGDKDTQFLIEESHKNAAWSSVKHLMPTNPLVDLSKTQDDIINFNKNIFSVYTSFDFSKIKKERINGNVFYFDKDLVLSDEIISRLYECERSDEPRFIEIEDGELIFS